MRKFEIWLINLNPKKGHVQAGMRPCIIIQSNLFNFHSSSFIVIPLTTTTFKTFPSEFLVKPSKNNGLSKISRALGSQIVTVDKKFFHKKIGKLENKYWTELQKVISISLDWKNDFKDEENF